MSRHDTMLPATTICGGHEQRDELSAEEPSVRLELMEDAIRQFLTASGIDTRDPHLVGTPERVARTYSRELLSGYGVSLEHIFKTFEESSGALVLVRDIPVYSLCAHHLLPFYGSASIGYQPNGRILGLSKMARLVDCLSRRLQVQERLTAQIVDALQEHLEPRGVAVLVRAEHLCMSMRGISKPKTETVTYLTAGEFSTDAAAATRILTLLRDG